MVWIAKWEIESHSRDKVHIVSLSDSGEWGCSCEGWIYQRGNRKPCKHIQQVRNSPALEVRE